MARADAKYSVTLEDKTQRALRQIQGNLGRVQSGFATLGKVTAILGGVGGSGFVLATRGALNFADAIGKAADAGGVTTTTYQKYTDALSFANIQQTEFDQALKSFIVRVGEAQNGTGELTSKLRVNNAELLESIKNAKSQDEALQLVFDAMGNARNATERATIANAAFSEAGIKMARATKQGADAFNAQLQAAEDSGRVIEERLIRSSEEANDRINELSRTISISFRTAVLEAAPAIADLAEEFKDATPIIVDAARAVGSWIAKLNENRRLNASIELAEIGVQMGEVALSADELRRRLDGLSRKGQDAIQVMFVDSDGKADLSGARERLQQLDAQMEALQARRTQLEASLAAPMQIAAPVSPGASGEAAADPAAAERERQFAMTQAVHEGVLERMSIAKMWADYEQEQAGRRVETERFVADTMVGMQQVAASNMGEVSAFIAGQSKDAARAVLLVNKGLQAANVVVNAEAAKIRALAELGPIAGPEAVAAIELQKNISLATIAAATLTGAASINGGGGRGGLGGNPSAAGGSLNPINTLPSQQQSPQRVVNVYVSGLIDVNSTTFRNTMQDVLRESADADVVIFSANSAQAQTIRDGF